MPNDPAFLFYPGDYLRDTQCLSEPVQVAYDRIMCEHMRNISEDMSNISISQKMYTFFTKRLSDHQKEELELVLEKTPAGFQIPWVALSISKRKSYSDSRRKNRGANNKNHMLTYDRHMDNENENENENITVIENAKKLNVEFSVFWNAYQKKAGDQEKIEKKWKSLSNDDRNLIMKHVPVYVKSTPDKTYRKHPYTYLNQKGWKDEIINQNKNGTHKGNFGQKIIPEVRPEGSFGNL